MRSRHPLQLNVSAQKQMSQWIRATEHKLQRNDQNPKPVPQSIAKKDLGHQANDANGKGLTAQSTVIAQWSNSTYQHHSCGVAEKRQRAWIAADAD